MRDEKRTLECLKKGVRIASQCLDTGVQVQIYVELLNHYLFYFERGNSLITVTILNHVSDTQYNNLRKGKSKTKLKHWRKLHRKLIFFMFSKVVGLEIFYNSAKAAMICYRDRKDHSFTTVLSIVSRPNSDFCANTEMELRLS